MPFPLSIKMWKFDVHAELCCGLDVPLIESRIVWEFRHSSGLAFGSTQASIHGLYVISKRIGLYWSNFVIYHPSKSWDEIKLKGRDYVFSSSGSSWLFLGKLRLVRRLITALILWCENIVSWFPHFGSDRIYYPSPLSLLYLSVLNTFCIEIPKEFSFGSLRTEWISPLVPSEICLLKLSRLWQAHAVKNLKNDVLILHRLTTH